MPQALNRYAAAPLGQPGVFQAAAGDGFNWIPSAASFVYGTTTQLVGHTSKVINRGYTGEAFIEVIASKNALTKEWRNVSPSIQALFGSDLTLAFKNGRQTFYTREGTKALAGNNLDDLYKAADEVVGSLRSALPGSGPWAARISSQVRGVTYWQQSRLYNQLDNWAGAVTGVGAALDFVVGFGFQLHNDWNTPYLTSAQVWGRAVVAGGGSSLAGVAGGLIGFKLGLFCGPGAIVCSPVGAVIGAVGGGLIWNEWGQPFIFDSFGLQPANRNLKPLN